MSYKEDDEFEDMDFDEDEMIDSDEDPGWKPGKLNPLKPSGLVHPYQLDKSISNLRH